MSWEPPEAVLLIFSKESEREDTCKDVMAGPGVIVL